MSSKRKREEESLLDLPQHWLRCPNKSLTVIADRFVSFKTPVDDRFDCHLEADEYFHPCLTGFSSSPDQPIGLWIDLTEANPYYCSEDVKKLGCKYVNIPIMDDSEIPSTYTVNHFIKICSQFINQNPGSLIGVHGIFGFNRTGFLIVSYLVRALHKSVATAVEEFSEARPPGIFREHYLIELFRRYGELNNVSSLPPLPAWLTTSQIDDTNNNNISNNLVVCDDIQTQGKMLCKSDEVSFMEGIPKVKLVTDSDIVTEVKKKIKKLTGFVAGWFPGQQAVSMSKNNMKLLEEPYLVTWKADSTRSMMYIKDQSKIFLIDRKNTVFQIEGVSFLSKEDLTRHLTETLVDGEMVIDSSTDIEKFPRYLISDIISLNGKLLLNNKFSVRYRLIQEEIIYPRTKAMALRHIVRNEQSIGIRAKKYFSLDQSRYILDEYCKTLGHRTHGLVFQPINEPYRPGLCKKMLSWTVPSHHTVDFRLKIIECDNAQEKIGQLFVGSGDGRDEMHYDFIKVEKNWTKLLPFDNKIIECRYDLRDAKWIFFKLQPQKKFPSSFNTAQAVFQSIMKPLTIDVLMGFIRKTKTIDIPLSRN